MSIEILEIQRAGCLEDCLIGDLKDFNFPHLEILWAREEDLAGQSGVIGVRIAKASVTAGVCVAVARNSNVTTVTKSQFSFNFVSRTVMRNSILL
jgi:hypothetical protein